MSQRAGKGSGHRTALTGAVAALALIALAAPVMLAAPAAASNVATSPQPAVIPAANTAQLTDVGAAKRKRRAVRHNHGPSAAGMAFMGMALGMVGSAIAESQRRDYYDHYYGHYSYGPRYYRQPGYGYYGGAYQPQPYYYYGY
jgi:hypothetical protein